MLETDQEIVRYSMSPEKLCALIINSFVLLIVIKRGINTSFVFIL